MEEFFYESYRNCAKNRRNCYNRTRSEKPRKINKDLTAFGYEDKELSVRVLQNLDFTRVNRKANIYDQAVLEEILMYSEKD